MHLDQLSIRFVNLRSHVTFDKWLILQVRLFDIGELLLLSDIKLNAHQTHVGGDLIGYFFKDLSTYVTTDYSLLVVDEVDNISMALETVVCSELLIVTI